MNIWYHISQEKEDMHREISLEMQITVSSFTGMSDLLHKKRAFVRDYGNGSLVLNSARSSN